MKLKTSNAQRITLSIIALWIIFSCLNAWPSLSRYDDLTLSNISITYVLLPAICFSVWHVVYNNLTRAALITRAKSYPFFLRLILIRSRRFRILSALLISLSLFLDRTSQANFSSWSSEVLRFSLSVFYLDLSFILMTLWMAVLLLKFKKEHYALLLFLSYPLGISILQRRDFEGFSFLLPLPFFQKMPKYLAGIESYEMRRAIFTSLTLIFFLVLAVLILRKQFAQGRPKDLFIREDSHKKRGRFYTFLAQYRQVLLLLHLPMIMVFLTGYFFRFRQLGAQAYYFSYYAKPYHWANFNIISFFFWFFYRYWPILYLSSYLYDLIMRQGIILIPRMGRVFYFKKVHTDLLKLLALFYGIQSLGLLLMLSANSSRAGEPRVELILAILASLAIACLNAFFWISLGNGLLLRWRRLDLPILLLFPIILMDLWMAKSSEQRVRARWTDYLNFSSYTFPRIIEDEYALPSLVWIVTAGLINVLAVVVVSRFLSSRCHKLEVY